MKVFKFSVGSTKNKQDLVTDLCNFLEIVNKSYENQISYLQDSNIELEKMFNSMLKPEKENNFMKKITGLGIPKEEQPEPQTELINKFDEDVVKAIIKAEETLKEVDEKPLKPVKATLKPYMQKLAPQKGQAGKMSKGTPVSTFKKDTKTTMRSNSLARPNSQTATLNSGINLSISGRLGAKQQKAKEGETVIIMSNDSHSIGNKSNYHFSQNIKQSNNVSVIPAAIQSVQSLMKNKELVKEIPSSLSKLSNPVDSQIMKNYFGSQEETKVIDEGHNKKAKIVIASFKSNVQNFIKKKNIEVYTDIKKYIKKKVNEFNDNAKYHNEKEKKAKSRFLGKLNSHLANSKKIWNKTLTTEEVYTVNSNEYSKLSKNDIQRYNVCKRLVAFFKTSLNLENNELKNILNSSTMMDAGKSEANLDVYILNIFKSWYFINFVEESKTFLQKELEKMTTLEAYKSIMINSQKLAKLLLTFKFESIIPNNKTNDISSNLFGRLTLPLNQLTFKETNNKDQIFGKENQIQIGTKDLSGSNSNVIELNLKIRNVMINTKLKDKNAFKKSEEFYVIRINLLSIQHTLLTILKQYCNVNYPIVNNNIKVNKDEDFKMMLKILRVLYCINDKNCRLPLFLLPIEREY